LPLLLRAKRGEGQPVLLIPGFTSSDNATWFVRKYLGRLGYDVYGWGQGANDGLSTENFEALRRRLTDIHQRTGRKVSLVGWSLGGFYVRALANKHSIQVRNIITVGTTFSMPTPKAVNRVINRLYGHLNPYQQMDAFFIGSDLWECAPPLPSTSIYSKGDGVNNWRHCLDKTGKLSENVQVCGSHSGLTVNPLVYYVLADRLAQDAERWQPFAAPKIVQHLSAGLAASS
jgi:pimeloyl-ACP methyl ester carboxylesterase